jgi:hypothetical protein
MEQENKDNTQVVIHKSNWGSQLINVIIVVIVIFLSITNNPTKKDFISQVVSELAKKQAGLGVSMSNAIGDYSANTFGDLIEPFIVRRNFLLFSTYEIDFNNQEFTLHASAFGLWGNIIVSGTPNISVNTIETPFDMNDAPTGFPDDDDPRTYSTDSTDAL